MERQVQWAKAQVRHAKREPFTHLDYKALSRERITTVAHRYSLEKELDERILHNRIKSANYGPKKATFPGCMCSNFHSMLSDIP